MLSPLSLIHIFISGDLIRTFFSAYPGEGVGEKRIFPVDLKFDLIKHEYEAVEDVYKRQACRYPTTSHPHGCVD